MRNLAKALIVGAFFLCFSAGAFADVLYLKNGEKLEGRVVKETQGIVTFEIQGGRVDFRRSEIRQIERDSQGEEAVPVPSAAVSGKALPQAASARVAPAEPGPVKKAISAARKFSIKNFTKEWTGKISRIFSRAKSAGSSRSRNQKPKDPFAALVPFLIAFVAQILAGGLALKGYFAITGSHVTYLRMVWFQLKLALVYFAIGFAVGCCSVLVFGEAIGSGGIPSLKILGIYVFFGAVAYFVMAKRDLEVGFVEAVLMSVILNTTYFAVAKGLVAAGFGNPTYMDLMIKSLFMQGGGR